MSNHHSYGDGCAHHRTTEGIPVSDLVYRSDVVGRLNLQKATVNRWIERRKTTGFPLPVKAAPGQSEIYDWQEVWAWWLAWSRTRKTYWGGHSEQG